MNPDKKSAEFKVSGMTCMGCANHVRIAINNVEGILSASVSHESANAIVEYDSRRTDFTAIEQAINSTGYKVVETIIM